MGGEEFVLILPGADAEAAEDCAERARAALAELTVRGRPLGASAGLAAAPADGLEPAVLLEHGVEAVTTVFQPVVELATGRAGGFEALARIEAEPRRGPDEWFAQGHRVGLGEELEALAIRSALSVPGRPEGTFLALNVSPRALLSAPVQAALPEDLNGIVIELTEHEVFGGEGELDGELARL